MLLLHAVNDIAVPEHHISGLNRRNACHTLVKLQMWMRRMRQAWSSERCRCCEDPWEFWWGHVCKLTSGQWMNVLLINGHRTNQRSNFLLLRDHPYRRSPYIWKMVLKSRMRLTVEHRERLSRFLVSELFHLMLTILERCGRRWPDLFSVKSSRIDRKRFVGPSHQSIGILTYLIWPSIQWCFR